MRTPRALTCVPLVLVAIAACAKKEVACDRTAVPGHEDDTIVIEGDEWAGYAPFRGDDLLTNTGHRTLYVEQLCQAQRAADLDAGRADIILTSLDQYLLHQPRGTIVGIVDQSNGADALVLNNQSYAQEYLNSVEDLPQLVSELAERGETPVLAYSGDSPSEVLLDELSNTYEELRLHDFELVAVDQSATAYQWLRDGDAHLAMLREPDLSEAVARDYPVALSSKDAPDSIVNVIVAGDRFLETDEDAVRVLLREFYAQMDAYLADPAATLLEELLMEDFAASTDDVITEEQASDIVDGLILYDTARADAFMNRNEYPLDRPQLEQSIDAIGSLLALIHPGVDPDQAKVDGHYVRELAQ